jgi:hypothetical protein
MRHFLGLAFVLSFSTGCVSGMSDSPDPGPDDVGDDDDDDDDDDVNPDPEPEPDPDLPPPLPSATGTYTLTSTVEIPATAVLPAPAADLVGLLGDLREEPAATLFGLLEDAGVPLVDDLRDALPGVVEDELEDWIDDEIFGATVGGVPIGTLLDELRARAESALTSFAITSELEVPEVGLARHRLLALDFAPAGIEVAIAVDDVAAAADIVEANPAVSVAGSADAATLEIDAHAFAIAYGEAVWAALEAATIAEWGAGMRDLLGEAVDCPAVAAAVADQCLLGVCVGHQADLEAICDDGLDLLVEQIRGRITALRFDALALDHGTAALAATGELTDGVWQASLNLGQGLHPVPATFAGVRAAR